MVTLSGCSRNFRNFHDAACLAGADLLTMNISPPWLNTPPFPPPGVGKGATPRSMLGSSPASRIDLIVPSAALVSNAIACEPLRMPSRSS